MMKSNNNIRSTIIDLIEYERTGLRSLLILRRRYNLESQIKISIRRLRDYKKGLLVFPEIKCKGCGESVFIYLCDECQEEMTKVRDGKYQCDNPKCINPKDK